MTLNNLINMCGEYVNIQIEDTNSMDIIATYDYNDKTLSDDFDNALDKYGEIEWRKGFTFEIDSNWIHIYIEVKE